MTFWNDRQHPCTSFLSASFRRLDRVQSLHCGLVTRCRTALQWSGYCSSRFRYSVPCAGSTVVTVTTKDRPNTPPVFHCAHSPKNWAVIKCSTNTPDLLGVVWDWSGGPHVAYGRDRYGPAGVVAVPYNWEEGTVELDFTPAALEQFLSGYYTDPGVVTATVEDITRQQLNHPKPSHQLPRKARKDSRWGVGCALRRRKPKDFPWEGER